MIIPILSGNYNRMIAHIQNITQDIKIQAPFNDELTILPNVAFSGDTAIFSFEFNINLKKDVILKIQGHCNEIIRKILNKAELDALDENLGKLSYEYVDDNLQNNSFTNKNYKTVLNYKQTWKLNLE